MLRVLFLGEGTSDSGITTHIKRIATERRIDVVITDPLVERLPHRPNKTIAGKLRAIKGIGGVYDLVAVHRDADRAGRDARLAEIKGAVGEVMPGVTHAPIIPIRMTEAWLLLDERQIRLVAGNPNGKTELGLPNPGKVESIADPKAVLADRLCLASGLNGRKLTRFKQRFPQHRRQLLERIDPEGPIAGVSSWRDFNTDLHEALELAVKRRS
jgi:hypothetical protein